MNDNKKWNVIFYFLICTVSAVIILLILTWLLACVASFFPQMNVRIVENTFQKTTQTINTISVFAGIIAGVSSVLIGFYSVRQANDGAMLLAKAVNKLEEVYQKVINIEREIGTFISGNPYKSTTESSTTSVGDWSLDQCND